MEFYHGDYGVGGDEAREVINVAVCVVPGDPPAKPDDVRCAQVVGESFLIVDAGHAGIALLHFAEQAFLGGEDRAASVDVDGTAFEYDASAAGSSGVRDRADLLSVRGLGHVSADFFVVTPVRIFGPGVEAEF